MGPGGAARSGLDALAQAAGVSALRRWWADLDGSWPGSARHAGTVANANLGQLLVPALRALAREDGLVVAMTGIGPRLL